MLDQALGGRGNLKGFDTLPACFLRAAAIAALLFVGPKAFAASLDDEVLSEINFARMHPSDYARELRSTAFDGASSEDPDAVEEAIVFLERQPALPPLERDGRIAAAAREHAANQGARGDMGHGPTGSLGRRLQENGVWAGLSAENISYGYDDARDVVRQLIIDSRVPSRGHRRNIFTRDYRAAGVACGPHRSYGAMCVIDFAGAIVQR